MKINPERKALIIVGILFLFGIQIQSQPIAPVIVKQFRSFCLDEVSLKDKEFRPRQDHDFKYIQTLEPDKYLSPFRRNAGVVTDSKGNPVDNTNHYNGWESMGSSTFGHYLSALSMMYKVTGDTILLRRINYIIDELDFIQNHPGYNDENLYRGVLVAFDRDVHNHVREPNFLRTYNELREGKVNLTSAPNRREDLVENPNFKSFYWLSGGLLWYTNHKIYAGIRDAYLFTGSPKARKVFLFFCDWACWVTGKLSDKTMNQMLYSEFGGLNEMLAEAYALSGNSKYMDCAYRFSKKESVVPCMTGDKEKIAEAISHTHANAQIPQFYGLLKEYEYTGNPSYKLSTEHFFDYVLMQQSFVTGGNSEWEQFRTPGDITSQVTRRSGETCNTYNMLKIAKGLYEYSGDCRYADYIERALYNHILPSIHTSRLGAFTYFLSLEPGYFKTFSRPYDSHWCCVGTGMENHAKYGEFIYFSHLKKVFVNLYVASALNWKEQGFRMETRTDFPRKPKVKFSILQNDGGISSLCLRVPGWAEALKVSVNGRQVRFKKTNGYIHLDRKWKIGDEIEVEIPMKLRKEYMPNCPDQFAFFYGPVLLAGCLGKDNMPESVFARGENDFTRTNYFDYKGNIPFFSEGTSTDKCLKKVECNEKLCFKAINGVEFVPLYEILEERYSVYWQEK